MSIEVIKNQIEKFLDCPTPEVMAIKGKWGIGKTYTWEKLLSEAKTKKQIKFEKYSYVSLFGINSLEAFKYAVFGNVIKCDLIDTEASLDTFLDNPVGLTAKQGKFLLDVIKSNSTTHAIESLAFLSLKNIIICIDDLERKGKNLDLQDVLGLISLLKEQKKCKIVLLINDGEKGLEDYDKYREKVIDIELEFAPSAFEIAEIAFDNKELNDDTLQILKECSIKLNIKNIRVLKKIERHILQIIPYLSDYEVEITSQIIQSLSLFCWCYYCHESDKKVPNLDFVCNLDSLFFDTKNESDDHKNWRSIIYSYGYNITDELDVLLSNFVKTGYFIEAILKDKAAKKNEEIIASKSAESFHKAWDLYHGSFDNNQDEVISTLYSSFKENIHFISPNYLNGTVSLFREVGENDKSDEIIDLYIKTRSSEIALFNTDMLSHYMDKKDMLLFENFNQHYRSSVNNETAYQVLERISKNEGYNSNDEKLLANSTVDEFYNIFKSLTDKETRNSFVNSCLNFRRIVNANEDMLAIVEKATKALKRIANESDINKSRVKLFGIEVDE